MTTTVSGSWTLPASGPAVTEVPTIPSPPGTQQNSYTSYNGGTFDYTLYTFVAADTGTFTATIGTTGVVNTAWFVNDTFAPASAETPTTPVSDFIAGVFSGATLTDGYYDDNFSNLPLTAGNTYTILLAYDSTSSTLASNYDITTSEDVACFASGTRIATPRGEVAVERLQVGDLVRTQDGRDEPVAWIGHRQIDIARHSRPRDVLPVRILASAFADHLPARDLWLSPDHAVFVDGALIPVRYLINDASIMQEHVDQIGYWHVELARHDVLLAEGMPCESFLDTGNRSSFANAMTVALHPSFAPRTTDHARDIWARQACAPLTLFGPRLEAVRARLDARAGARLPPAETIHLERTGTLTALLPTGTRRVHLLSPCFHPGGERRRLGAAIAAIAIGDKPLSVGWPGFATGFHDAEANWRWTDGAAVLLIDPLPSPSVITIDVVMLAVAQAA